jgi:hypothetical protein
MTSFWIFSGVSITIQDCDLTELELSELNQLMRGSLGNLDHIFPHSDSHGKSGHPFALAQSDRSFISLYSELSG